MSTTQQLIYTGSLVVIVLLWGLCHRLERIEQRIRDLESRDR